MYIVRPPRCLLPAEHDVHAPGGGGGGGGGGQVLKVPCSYQ